MNELDKLLPALAAAQAEYKPLKRSGKVKASDRMPGRDYSTLADMLDACGPALRKHGLLLMWLLSERCVVLKLWHVESGQHVESCLPLTPHRDGRMNDTQALGSYISYARRYLLNALLGLEGDYDDDGEGAVDPAREPDEVYRGALQVFTGATEIPSLEELCVRTKTDPAKVLKAYKVKSFGEMTAGEVDDARRKLEAKLQ